MSAHRRTWLGLSLLAALPLGACEPDALRGAPVEGEGAGSIARRGGQSGTEGGGDIACDETPPRDVTPDEVLPFFGRSLNDLAATLAGVTAPGLPGVWFSTGTRAELSVVIPAGTAARQLSSVARDGWICASLLEIEALEVRSSDGVIVARMPARVRAPGSVLLLDATLPPLPDGYLGQAAWAGYASIPPLLADFADPAPSGAAPTLRVAIEQGFAPPYTQAGVFHGQDISGFWTTQPMGLPFGPPTPYTPSAPLAAECAGADVFADERRAYTPFSDAAAALQGIAGTWLRCRDNAASAHAGLEILPDGSWHHFELEGGELVARFGFEHEGFVEVSYSLSPNEPPDTQGPGPYDVRLEPLGRRFEGNVWFGADSMTGASEEALVFNMYGPNWPAAVYLPTSAPVRAAAPEYADGQRAGAAACERGERGIVSTNEELASLLTGDFILCSGTPRDGLARIHFEESSVTLLRADGSVILSHAYEEPIAARVRRGELFGEPLLWRLLASRSPLKLWIDDGVDDRSNVAVFSALP
ncbi:MAG TPA: hypothetical protein VJU61_10990 [Polyangiaceae bacterium]|nr:hypothetical protein [Polyangiaceae bacterium]